MPIGHTIARYCLALLLVVEAGAGFASDPYRDLPYAASSANGNGAAATVHPLATQAALGLLEQGGNAIDAAIAAAFALGVVDSHNSGIGGGNFAIVRFADGHVAAIDGREMAPAKAYRDMYMRNGVADGDLSTTGALAIGIPGSVAVYEYLQQHGAKKSWGELIAPAASLAEQGFPLAPVSAERLASSASTLRRFPAAAAVLLDDKGNPWPTGHWLKQPDLANTYRQLAKQGSAYFYRGDFARAVAQWMAQNGGIVTADDFANYQMRVRQPVVSQYRGYTIYGFPPPSSGGVHVAEILNILSQFELRDMGVNQRHHVLAEAMKLAFADRAFYLGDPDFVDVPKGLIDPAYAVSLAKAISMTHAAKEVRHGRPPRADIDLFGKHTTHISTADRWGNWVAITTTVNTSFGSKVMIPGTGVIMNNQMDDFSIAPGVPNAFGLVGNEANSVQPGKRPLSSMSPTVVVHDGKPVMTLGAAGGPTIITQVVQALVNVIDLEMSPAQALAAERIHHQWQPDMLFIENSLPGQQRSALRKLGHRLFPRGFAGATQLIVSDGKDGFEAASEPRVIRANTSDSDVE